MYKRLAGALCAALLVTGGGAKAAQVENSAASAILVDARSGRVLYEKNAHEQRGIASITKLLTALVVAFFLAVPHFHGKLRAKGQKGEVKGNA